MLLVVLVTAGVSAHATSNLLAPPPGAGERQVQLAPSEPVRTAPRETAQRPIAPSYRTMRQAAEAGVQPLDVETHVPSPAAVPVDVSKRRIDPLVAGVLAGAVLALVGIVFVLRRVGQGSQRD
jgi:hypothetical protein